MDKAQDQRLRSTQKEDPASSGQNQAIALTEQQMGTQALQNIQLRQKMAKLFQQYRSKCAEPFFKKYKVRVTSKPFAVKDKISVTVTKKEKAVPVNVENAGVKRVYLTFQTFDFVKNTFTVRDRHGNIIKSIKDHPIRPGESYKMKIHFNSDFSGVYEQLLIFNFKRGIQHSEKFDIIRLLEVIRQTPPCENFPAQSKPEKSFQTTKRKPRTGCEILLKPVVFLKKYPLPQNITNTVERDMDLEEKPLSWNNYSWRFHLLLHLEEYEIQSALEKCNREDVLVITDKNEKDMLLVKAKDVLKISNVVLTGCNVLVTPLNQEQEVISYRGWVDDVDEEQIYMKFEEIFPREFNKGVRCSLLFSLQRMPLRTQHRAAALVGRHRLMSLLFPGGLCFTLNSWSRAVIPKFNSMPSFENNPEQQKAIAHILARSAKPAPYLIFGPPGTGKTVTLVEVIKQIIKTQDCNILVCAPSNSATDHLCEKILNENRNLDVFRLYSLSYKLEKIPQIVKGRCSYNAETSSFEIPTKEDLMQHQIMVTTLQTAGRLVTGGVPPGYYSYIIVDEAGQAVETECLIPMAGLLKPEIGQVVLAGDPKQLGPVVVSQIAARNGLGVSLLERLMTESSLYQPHMTNGFNGLFMTKLLRNYRSHPAILKIPNELFYDSELQPCGHHEDSLYNKWELLPRKDFPVMFHGVAGKKEQDPNNPSVYNMAEVDIVKKYLKSIISYRHRNGLKTIKRKEIGIVTPYKKQVEKIKASLYTDRDLIQEDLENVLVGTVEIFQGEESDVILVSTVRSHPSVTSPKQGFGLGFVKDEKRFNVAMTRARKLLIVIGDPRVLEIDPMWNKFICYCIKERAYCGIIVSCVKGNAVVSAPSPSPCSQQEVRPKPAFSWKNQRHPTTK